MIVDKVHEVISFRQSDWLEKYIDFNTKERAIAKTEFEKDLPKGRVCSFYGKTMENIRNRIKIEPIKKDEVDKILKWQSKLTFAGIHKEYENYSTYTFKQNEITNG